MRREADCLGRRGAFRRRKSIKIKKNKILGRNSWIRGKSGAVFASDG